MSSRYLSRTTDPLRPWRAHRGNSPLAFVLRLEEEAALEATSRESWLELLQRATPAQILEASRGVTSNSSALAIAAAWDRLRKAVS